MGKRGKEGVLESLDVRCFVPRDHALRVGGRGRAGTAACPAPPVAVDVNGIKLRG
jgi:hypothetical protein